MIKTEIVLLQNVIWKLFFLVSKKTLCKEALCLRLSPTSYSYSYPYPYSNSTIRTVQSTVQNNVLGAIWLNYWAQPNTRQEAFCRVSKNHLAKRFFVKCFFLSIFCLALGKELLYRISEKKTWQTTWHSAKSRIPIVLC